MRRWMVVGVALGCGPKGPPAPAGPAPEVQYQRLYTPGGIDRFRLESVQFQNGERVGRTVGISEHTLSELGEEVRWVTLMREVNGGLVERDAHHRVAPYPLSLLPGGALDVPPHGVGEMDSLITDQVTMWIAVQTAGRSPNLLSIGDAWTAPAPFSRDWSNPAGPTRVGVDCLLPTTTLIRSHGGTAGYLTRMDPPPMGCAGVDQDPRTADPVVQGFPNNFLQRTEDGRASSLLWGKTSSVVRSTVATDDGRILGATMDIEMQLKLLECGPGEGEPGAEECHGPFPMEIRRRVTLQPTL